MESGTTGGADAGAGWRHAFLCGAAICVLMSLAMAFAIHSLNRRPRGSDPAQPAVPEEPSPYDAMPDLAWLGWIGGGVCFVALSLIRSIFPARALGGACHLTEGTLGSIFFVLSLVQALVGLALTRSRFWMYRPRPVAAFAVAGMLGTLCFALGSRPAVFLAGAILFGIYSGAFCFYLVFHALVHPRHAGRYVAVNESLVGLTGFLAPLAGGAMADAWGFRLPYLGTVVLILAATAVLIRVHRR